MGSRKPKLAVPAEPEPDTESTELVLALSTVAIDRVTSPNKPWIPHDTQSTSALMRMVESDGVFIPRNFAEHTRQFMQIIPYTIISLEAGEAAWYVCERLKASGDPRLRGFHSLGIGGHITTNEDGWDLGNIVERARERELDEEVALSSQGSFAPVAVINDRDYEVSAHHLGFVYRVTCSAANIKEKDKLKGQFASVSRLRTSYNLENWSQLILHKYLIS